MSHSYQDEPILKQLQTALPKNVKPVIFPPIEVPVTQFVSDQLLDTIEKCSGLIFLDADASRDSFWVSLEVEQAKRRNKKVYKFDPNTKSILEETSPHVDFPIYISFAAVDEDRVRQIALWTKHRRGFDLWYQEQTGALNEIFTRTKRELRSIMEAGGYLVAFVSEWSSKRGNLRNEVVEALQMAPSNVLLAWLDDPKNNEIRGVNIPIERQIFLRPNVGQVQQTRPGIAGYWPDMQEIVAGKNLPVLSCDLDDLVVRIYWMRKSSLAA